MFDGDNKNIIQKKRENIFILISDIKEANKLLKDAVQGGYGEGE